MTILTQKTVTKYGRSSHLYQTPEGELLPSVTSILSVVGKPALINWAANTERDLVCQAAADLYEDAPLATKKTERMSRPAYIATLLTRLGRTKAHQRELAKASEIGREAHGLIEWHLRKALGQKVGPEPKVSEKALWAFMVYEDWRKTVDLTPVAIEQIVWHPKRKYAGTMDLLARLTLPTGTFLVVIDWKTSKALYSESLMQNAAYVKALIAMGHAGVAPPVLGAVVRLPKLDTDPEPEVRMISWEEHETHYQTFLAVKTLWHWQQEQDAQYEARKNVTPTQDLTTILKASVAATEGR